MQKANIGGILGIVASVLGMLGSLLFFALPSMMSYMDEPVYGSDTVTLAMVTVVYVVLGVIGLLIGILGIIGGIFAIRRRVFALALTGAIASSIIFYPLGIASVILVSMGYQEFNRQAPAVTAPVAPPVIPPAI